MGGGGGGGILVNVSRIRIGKIYQTHSTINSGPYIVTVEWCRLPVIVPIVPLESLGTYLVWD